MPHSSTSSLTPDVRRPIRAVIVGGGRACARFLRMVQDDRLGRFPMAILGVADPDPDAPALALAREMGVPHVVADYEELLAIEGVELLVELTGVHAVRDAIERSRPPGIHVIDHFGARLFWNLHQAEEAIIHQRTEMQEEVERERERIAQIFDCIPDEIVVVDQDMVVQSANATFLRNNDLELGEVRGCYCYDLESAVRGDCQVAVENCPFFAAMRELKTTSMVRKHFDRDGETRYAAIVAAPLVDLDGEVVGMIEMTRDITNRIRLEEELKATEVKLRQFMERAPLATYVKNRHLQYLEANPATCRLLGHAKSEVIGKTDLEILPRPIAEYLRSHEREVLHQKHEVSYHAEIEVLGRRRYVETILYPVLHADGSVAAVCGLAKDITRQRETEAQLESTREYLQNILDHSPVMIVTTSLDSKMVSFNRVAEEVLGYTAEEALGQHASMLYCDPEARESLVRRVKRTGAVYDFETSLRRKDGTDLPVSITFSVLEDSEGDSIGYVGLARDISQRKLLLSQVAKAGRMAAIGQLAAGVAHEINNPLAVISETAGLLDDLVHLGVPSSDIMAELQKGLPLVAAQIRRARSITHRLLSFARKTQEGVEVADVAGALDEVLPFLEKEASLARVQVHRDYSLPLPRVAVEEVQLEEIFINLVRNAIQAIKPHGPGNIWIESEVSDDRVIITVRDDGPGITEDVQARLFDPFFTTKPAGQGTGLGLSICYGIVKRFDGDLRVESSPGEGARFHVHLKIAEPESP